MFLGVSIGAETALVPITLTETAQDFFTDADQANGNKITNPSGVMTIVARNASASDAATVTITAQNTSFEVSGYGTLTKANLVITLALGETKTVILKGTVPWNDSSGDIILAIGGVAAADVSLAALKGG